MENSLPPEFVICRRSIVAASSGSLRRAQTRDPFQATESPETATKRRENPRGSLCWHRIEQAKFTESAEGKLSCDDGRVMLLSASLGARLTGVTSRLQPYSIERSDSIIRTPRMRI